MTTLAGSLGSFVQGGGLYEDLKKPPVKRMQEAIKADDLSNQVAAAIGAIAGTLDVGQIISASGSTIISPPFKLPAAPLGLGTGAATSVEAAKPAKPKQTESNR